MMMFLSIIGHLETSNTRDKEKIKASTEDTLKSQKTKAKNVSKHIKITENTG